MKKKELLNEVMGVPKALDFWVNTFTLLLTGMAKKITDSEEIDETDFDWNNSDTGEEVTGKMYRGIAKINGHQAMDLLVKMGGGTEKSLEDTRNFLKSDNFKKFPMFRPSIKLTMLFLPDKVLEHEKDKDLCEASHNSHGSKLSPMGGDVVVYTNQEFTFKVYSPSSWLNDLNTEAFKKSVRTSVSHELLHAYESYMRLKGEGKSESTTFFGRETMLNAAAKFMKDRKYPQWSYFLNLVYLHLSFEINARVTQLYYELEDKGIKTYDEFMDAVKKTSAWREVKLLGDFNDENFIKSFEGSKSGGLMDMIEDIGEQIERSKAGLPPIKPINDPKKAMTHLIDGWNGVLQSINKDLSKMGYTGKLMDVVPPKAMEDPKFFFKFFEKRFHRKAEKFKKKLLRISSLLINKEKTEENSEKFN